jgi:hypothetical protein
MRRAPLPSSETISGQTPVLIWPFAIAALAALTLLAVQHLAPPDLDRLVPQGETFIPYTIT